MKLNTFSGWAASTSSANETPGREKEMGTEKQKGI